MSRPTGNGREDHNLNSDAPFADVAQDLSKRSLVVLPCGGVDGKSPLVKDFTKFSKAPSTRTFEKWVAQFSTANVGILCGPSRLVVVDIDDQAVVDSVIAKFGSTPLQTRTPSGGIHLWYRDSHGQKSRNLRESHDLPFDIKALRGFIVVPPSIRPHDKRRYLFDCGDW